LFYGKSLFAFVIIIISIYCIENAYSQYLGDDSSITDLLDKGNSLFTEGRYEEAIQYYDKVLEIEPNDVYVLYNKGNAFYSLGNYTEAIQYFDKALEIEPRLVEALTNKGLALADLGKYQEAIQYVDKALEIEPRMVEALTNKGAALAKLGKYQEAIQYFDKALEIDPNYIGALNNKGAALIYLGKYQEAIQYVDKALEIEPRMVEAITNKGLALIYLGKYQEAIQYFDKALEIEPRMVEAINNKANTLVRISEQSNTIKPVADTIYNNNYYYNSPIDPNPKTNLYLYEGINYNNDKHKIINLRTTTTTAVVDTSILEEAIKLYDQALSQDPSNPIVLINKGIAYSKLEKYEQSLQLFDKVLQDIEQNNIDAMCNKAKVLEKVGRLSEAEFYKDKIMELETKTTTTTTTETSSYECDLIDMPSIVEDIAF
jgi:tetratricopeptide (TPR) repeat protein